MRQFGVPKIGNATSVVGNEFSQGLEADESVSALPRKVAGNAAAPLADTLYRFAFHRHAMAFCILRRVEVEAPV